MLRVNDKTIRKILIIRTSSLGDIFHAFPALSAIKNKDPHVIIHWLIKEKFSDLLKPVKEIDKIYCLPRSRNFQTLKNLIRNLRMEKYDAVIDFQGLLRTGLWAFLTGSPLRLGFTRHEARHKLSCLFTNIHVRPSKNDRHIVEKNLSLLRPLGIAYDPNQPSISYHMDQKYCRVRDEFLQKKGLRSNQIILGVHMGASWRHATKCWPLSHYQEFLKEMSQRFEILILWGPDEEKKIGLLRPLPHIHVAPRLSLLELAAFIERCDLLVGSDSGPIHMAAALDIPTLCLMGPTSPERLRPWGPQQHYIHKGTHSPLCLKNICVRDHRCMKTIHVEEVVETVTKLLTAHHANH